MSLTSMNSQRISSCMVLSTMRTSTYMSLCSASLFLASSQMNSSPGLSQLELAHPFSTSSSNLFFGRSELPMASVPLLVFANVWQTPRSLIHFATLAEIVFRQFLEVSISFSRGKLLNDVKLLCLSLKPAFRPVIHEVRPPQQKP